MDVTIFMTSENAEISIYQDKGGCYQLRARPEGHWPSACLYVNRQTLEALGHAIEAQLQSEAELVRAADDRTATMEDAVRVLNAPDRETVTL